MCDLGSGNGTYIGTRRVLEYKLSNGNVLRIGDQEIRFETDSEDEVADESEAAVEGAEAGAPKKTIVAYGSTLNRKVM